MHIQRTVLWLVLAAACCAPSLAAAGDLQKQVVLATVKFSNSKSTATAVIFRRPRADSDRPDELFLVTAAHVLEIAAGDEGTLTLRPQVGETFRKQPVPLAIRRQGQPLWTRHETADVAAIRFEPPAGASVPSLPIDVLATEESLQARQPLPGDLVRYAGYPHQVEANELGFPVVRVGCLASFPILPLKQTKTLLMDANSFEGDSGGPVYLLADPPSAADPSADASLLVLGLVVGQHYLNEETRLAYGSTRVRHRLGLAIVSSAIWIREVLDRIPAAD